jgi:8-oxo-dGTP pyrophosphatase MutT (NUDIX family)
VSVPLFRVERPEPRFLMLRRLRHRGGFWPSVTGAPLPNESETEAAVREVREETNFDVAATLRAIGVSYSYALRPELAQRWENVYGRSIAAITVVAFIAEVPPHFDPVLDPREHDAFMWCGYDEAMALLEWPIEKEALHGRRHALQTAAETIQNGGIAGW